MAYQICGRCSKMFEQNKELYCPPCSEKNKKDYDLIINHIRENPGATAMDIILATGATLRSINCFIEDGSISYIKDPTNSQGKIINIPDKAETKAGRFHSRGYR